MKAPLWKRNVNWGIHFTTWIIIGTLVWPMEIWKYITVLVCLTLASSAAHWRGANEET